MSLLLIQIMLNQYRMVIVHLPVEDSKYDTQSKQLGWQLHL
jgi:hypothetical protein